MERRRWEWPPPYTTTTPITDARRRPRLRRDPAGRVLGRNRCHLSPSIPLCQHLGGGAAALFLSSLLLIRTPGRCRSRRVQPLLLQQENTSSIHRTHPHTQHSQDAGSLSRSSTSLKQKPHKTGRKTQKFNSTVSQVTLRGQTAELCRLRGFFFLPPQPPLLFTDPTTTNKNHPPRRTLCFIAGGHKTKRVELLRCNLVAAGAASCLMERVYD